jgi:hypothetical protein
MNKMNKKISLFLALIFTASTFVSAQDIISLYVENGVLLPQSFLH